MKKIFISLPMNGLDDDDVRNNIASLQEYVEGIFADEDEEISFIDSFVEEEPIVKDINIPAWYLSKSIGLISGADLVVFAPGWEHARGCIIEHMVCALYSIPYVEINPDMFFNIDEAFDDFSNDVEDNTRDWDVAGQVNAEISDAYSEATSVGEGFEHGDSDDNPYATHSEITQAIFNDYDDELEPGEYNADEDIQ